jgi:prepilin-type N-terminal cleavage/methylation domain-containing protein
MKRRRSGQCGFGLAEILAATAIVAIGLLAGAAAVQYALSGIEAGRGETLAAFLVEQKLEELKAIALVDWNNLALMPEATTEFCHPTGTGCSETPAGGLYRRATIVTDGAGGTRGTQCKIARVTVFYSPLSAHGQLDRERRLDVTTFFVART